MIYLILSHQTYIAIPYYAWDNRKPGRMDVWLDEVKQQSEELYHAEGS